MNVLRAKILAYQALRLLVLLYLLLLTIGNYFIHEYVYAGILLIALIIYAVLNIRSFSSNDARILGNQLIWLCLISFFSYRNYSKYAGEKVLIHYSKAFNHRREQLGIPIIPVWWHVSFKGSRNIEWCGNDSAIGHYSKFILTDSNRMILLERDDYVLKPQGKSERFIYVDYTYATRKHPDKLDFSYAVGDSVRSITKLAATDTLDANHIQKDY